MPATPEQQSRQKIDELLDEASWILQDFKQLNLGAARSIAYASEVPLKSGPWGAGGAQSHR